MNIYDVFNNGGVRINNPKWEKKKANIEPRTIIAPASEKNSGSIYGDIFNSSSEFGHMYLDPNAAKRAEELQKYGLTLNTDDDKAIELQLADAQSNWAKGWHALTQTVVNEIGLGTLRGISDLADFTIGSAIRAATGEENDYTNPVSETIQSWQKAFEEYQPIYRDTSKNIANGGLLDFGWWTSNMPSIASSLTLLLPSTGFAKGVSYLGKATRLNKGLGNARRFLTAIDKVDRAAEAASKTGKELNALQRASQFINNENTVRVVNDMFTMGVNGFTSRVMENYQEANQVYQDLLPEMNNTIREMDDNEYANFIERNKDVLKGVNTNDKSAVAKRLAKESADTTFRDDMWNGFFDVIELYGLRNVKRFMNNPMSASIRRKHLNSIKYAKQIEAGENLEEILKNRSTFTKVSEKVGDVLYGSKVAIGAQLSEGVEEAVNYIAQEEGMHYGHVLLGSAKENNFWDTRLPEYVKNPQLYDAAFWGVLGGVVFQAGGSYLAQARNAYNIKQDERKRKLDDKTKESVQNTPWSEAFKDPEIKRRLDNVEYRQKANATLREQLEQIKKGINPFEKNADGSNIILQTEEEKAIARDRAYNQRADNLLMNAMFIGNWDITKAYLESDEVRDAFVEARVISQEEGVRLQENMKRRANMMETLYSQNLRAVGNAMRSKDDVTGTNFSDVPTEYFQIIAAENMRHQLDAVQYDRNIANYSPVEGSEEERLKDELNAKGINYKETIRSFIIAQQLSQIEAELDATRKSLKEGRTKDDLDPRTISGQNAIRELEIRKRALTNMLRESAQSAPFSTNEGAKLLVTLRAAASAEKDGNGGYRINLESARYRKIDNAILNAFNAQTEDEWKLAQAALSDIAPEFKSYNQQQFKEAAHLADVFNENINRAVGENGTIEELDRLSHPLLNAYASITYNEIAREIELAHVAKDRESIRNLAHIKHNEMQAARNVALEMALHSIKAIAKKYNEEFGDISQELAYGTLNENARNRLKEILSPEDMRTYDDIMHIVALNNRSVTGYNYKTSTINSLLPEIIKDAVYQSSIDEFEEVDDRAVEEPNEENGENSSTSQNVQQSTQNSKVNNPTQKQKESNTSQKEQIKIDFFHTQAGANLKRPVASIATNATGAPIKFNQYTSSNTDYTDSVLIPVEGEENTYELDFKTELAEDAKDGTESVFSNPNFFNVKTPIIDGGTVISNPKVVVNDDGTVAQFLPGIIDNPASEESKEILAQEKEGKQSGGSTASIPSTGVLEQGEEVDPSTFDDEEETPVSEETYDIDNLNTDVTQEMMRFAKERASSGENYNEDDLYASLLDKYKGKVSEDDLRKAFTFGQRFGRKMASKFGLNIKELNDLGDFVDASALTDAKLGADETAKAKKDLDDAFKRILDNFAKRTATDVHNGKKVISVENLLRYANEVAGDNTMGHILYDKFIELLKESDDYEILEGRKLNKNSLLDRASMSEEERFDVSNSPNGRAIDLNYLIKRNNLSKEDREKLYDIIDELQPDDDLEYEVVDSGRGVEIRKNGFAVGRLYVPKVSSSNFLGTSTGWIVDIPKSNDGTQSKLEQLFIRIMVNSNNEKNIAPIISAIQTALITPATIYDKDAGERIPNPDYNKNREAILDAIDKAGINITEYINLNDKDSIELTKTLLNVYRGVKSASDQWLGKMGLSRKEYDEAIKNRRIASIHNWFERLRDSYSSAVALASNKNLKIKVDTVNQGGLVITSPDEAQPINEDGVIGSKHKGKLELVVASISDIGTMYSTTGASVSFGSFRPGSTFVAIPRSTGDPALVHAYPQAIDASHLKGEMKEIRDEVFAEFDRLLSEWSDNPLMSVSDITDFINKLCTSKGGNNALFRGLTVDKLTGGFEGIQISYFDNGRKKYIKLFDSNKYGKASVIKFGSDKATAFKDKAKRKEVLKQFREIIGKALTYNLEFDYVKGTRNLKGFATRGTKGQFVIQLPNGKKHTFKSFKDFIINNGLVAVTTKSQNGKTNFYRPGTSDDQFDKTRVTFKIVDGSSTPVKESKKTTSATTTTTPIQKKGDAIKSLIETNGKTSSIGEQIINNILNGTQLNILKNSRLFKELSLGNLIFVDKIQSAVAAHIAKDRTINGVNIPAGTIAVTQEWINLLNSDDTSRHEEAVRHLIHESIHRKIDTLSKEEQRKLFDTIRSIFDEFVAVNEKDGVRDSFRAFEYNTTKSNERKYYKAGQINDKGLEEFLVESITRPHLINRLNSIATDGGKISNRKVGNIRSKNLFQKILSTIAKLFNLNINKGSLLEKEYKLFVQVGITSNNNQQQIQEEPITEIKQESVTEPEPEQIAEQPKEETPQIATNVDDITIDSAMNMEVDEDDIDESDMTDKEVVSLGQVRDTIIPENRGTFENLVSKGAIQINC